MKHTFDLVPAQAELLAAKLEEARVAQQMASLVFEAMVRGWLNVEIDGSQFRIPLYGIV